jgi:hypothetical protein
VPEQPVGIIFKNRFIEAMDNFEPKKDAGSGLGLKGIVSRKRLNLRVNIQRRWIYSER